MSDDLAPSSEAPEPPDPALMGEAFRRGLLPPDVASAYQEAQRRGLVPGGEQAKPQEQAPEMGGFAKALTGLGSSLVAGAQGTSPIVKNLEGGMNYRPLGELKNADSGPIYIGQDGKWNPVDPEKHVVLNDPDSGKPTVYARSAATNEGALSSLGHIIQPGMLAPAGRGMQVADETLSKAQQTLSDFAAQKVSPSLPAVSGSRTAGIVQNALRETPGAAGAVEGAAQKSIAETGQAAERLAGQYGEAQDAKQAGDVIQDAVQGFVKSPAVEGMTPEQIIAAPTRSTSFAQKAGALYDRLGSHFADDDLVPLDRTLQALKGPVDRFPTSPELGKALTNPKLQQYFDILKPQAVEGAEEGVQQGGQLTFPEVKELRSTIGRMLDGSQLVNDIPRADLKVVYGALSKDMEAAAEAKGPQALKAFKQANDYYSAGMDRIDQLEKLAQGSPEGAYGAVLRAAQSGTKGDIGKLMAIRRATPDDQWGNIAAATLRTMGKPIASQADPTAEAAFSVPTFLTNYSKLSEGGKNVLFNSVGMAPLRTSLDQLVNVVAQQKAVTKLANPSGTGRNVIAAATGFLGATHPVMTALGLVGANVAARAMMSPNFVRWLYGASTAAPGMAATAANLARLDQIAMRDTSLRPIAQSLRSALASAGSGNPTTGSTQQPIAPAAP